MVDSATLEGTAWLANIRNAIRQNSRIAKILCSFILLFIVFLFVPLKSTLAVFLDFDLRLLASALVLIFLNFALSSVRLAILMSRTNSGPSFKVVHFINIHSQLAAYFFSTIGQMIARNAIGSLYTERASRLAAFTLLEKIVTAAVLFSLGLIGALTVSRSIGIIPSSFSHVALVSVAITMALVAAYTLGTTHGQRRYLRRLQRVIFKAGLERIAIVSLIMNLLMIAAYTLLGMALIPDASIHLLAALFAIVRLGALFPVSFGGWGVRELSAGVAFGVIGIDPAIGVAVAICIGGLSILALGMHVLIVHRYSVPRLPAYQAGALARQDLHVERMIAVLCALIVPVFIGVQLRIPTEIHLLSVNVADPLALVGALTFLTVWFVRFRRQKIWRIQYFHAGILCFLLMVGYGWLRGELSYGSNHWSDFNRGLGVFVLLCYLFCGAMIAAFLYPRFIRSSALVFLISTAVFFLVYISFGGHLMPETLHLLVWHPHHFNGLIGNRNALAFALLLILCVVIGFRPEKRKASDYIILGLLLFLILATSSRTGVVCAIVVVGLALIFRRRTRKDIAWISAVFVSANLFVYGLEALASSYGSAPGVHGGWGGGNSIFVGDQLVADPLRLSADRWQSYVLGLAMWQEYPLMGAGLGAFLESSSDFEPQPLSIHNTVLWILAEMGTVGLLLFMALPVIVLRHLIRHWNPSLTAADFSLLAVLISVVLFSQTHEIIYQRVLWFVLGMLAANKLSLIGVRQERKKNAD